MMLVPSASAAGARILPTLALLLALALGPLLTATTLPAQPSPGPAQRVERVVPRAVRAATDPVVVQAEQQLAAGDTTAALASLEAGLRQAPRNAARWHHAGLVRWMLAVRERSGGYIASKRTIDLLIGADTALRLATKFAPDSAQYWMSLARYHLQSDVGFTREAARGEFQRALQVATARRDTALMAVAADELGAFAWRRYELVAHRVAASEGHTVQLQSATSMDRNKAYDFVQSFTRPITPPLGAVPLAEAGDRFRDALRWSPATQRYGRHLYMVLAERAQWEELAQLAAQRTRRFPFDPQSQLAAGLALHRLGRSAAATAAFDSALALLDDDERHRLTRVTRLLRPTAYLDRADGVTDSAAFSGLEPAMQRQVDDAYWRLNDPLYTTPANEVRLEFLARVAHAEFRWTDEDLGVRGADTDRGDIFIRYGPPDDVRNIPGTSSSQIHRDGDGNLEAASEDVGKVTIMWHYRFGRTFFFDLTPGFATATLSLPDRQYVDDVKQWKPAAWDNAVARPLADVPVRVTRFRAAGDSMDVVVAAAIPVASLLDGVELGDPEVDLYVGLRDPMARDALRRQERARLAAAASGRMTRSWDGRIGRTVHQLRVEAVQPDLGRAAVSTVRVEPELRTGFGVSDLLLGEASPTGGALPASAATWRDLALRPSVGVYAEGERVAVGWETYGLTDSASVHRWQVAIRITRGDASGRPFALRWLDRAGALLGAGGERGTVASVRYTRSAPALARQAESVILDWVEPGTGDFTITITITDQHTGATTSRTGTLTVR